jgi:hypothetical protein
MKEKIGDFNEAGFEIAILEVTLPKLAQQIAVGIKL